VEKIGIREAEEGGEISEGFGVVGRFDWIAVSAVGHLWKGLRLEERSHGDAVVFGLDCFPVELMQAWAAAVRVEPRRADFVAEHWVWRQL